MKLKEMGAYVSIGILAVSFIASVAIAKNTINESKVKISEIEKAQQEYSVKQGVIEERTQTLQKGIEELKEDIKDNQKQLLDAIQKRR